MNDPMVPNKDSSYRTGPLDMDQVGTLETLLREGALIETSPKPIDIVFDGPPSEPAPRFVEVENDKGESIRAGEWIERPDGYWVLRLLTPEGCNCGQCGRIHVSGCAVHSEPAYPAGVCDCEGV